jgi:trigger factor
MMVGDYDTLEDLRASTREQLETEALQKAESEYLDKALDGFVEAAAQIEYPPQAIDREAEMALSQMESSLANSGIQLDTYLGIMGKTREMYMQELGPVAEERLKRRLVLDGIAEQEGLQVEPEEVEAELERMSEMMGPEADEMMATLSSPGGRLMVANDLVTTKAQQRAVQIAKGEAPPLEQEAEEGYEKETEDEAEAIGAEEEGVKAESKAEVDAAVETEPEVEAEEPAPEVPEEKQEAVEEPGSEDSD